MARRMRFTDTAVERLQGQPAEYTVWDTRTPGLGVRIRPSGGRSYIFQGRAGPDAVARRHTLGPATQWSVAEARRACLELQTAARPPALPGRRDGDASLRFRDFIETIWGPAFRERYKPSSRKGVEADLRSQLLPAFGTLRLERITPNVVHRWFDRYSATAPGGANHALRLLRTILRYAVRRGYLDRDPTATVRPNPRQRCTRFLSAEEIRRLHQTLAACEREHPSRAAQADIIRLLLLTGCRRGEILNLRWDEVDGNTLRLSDSKTGPRAVLLNTEAQRILLRQPCGVSPYVFPSPLDPERPRSRELHLWPLVRKRAGLEDVRLHDCRHTFASQAVLHGVPVPVVARLLGHRNAAMTLRYAHVRDKDIEAAAERIGTAIHTLLSVSDSRTLQRAPT